MSFFNAVMAKTVRKQAAKSAMYFTLTEAAEYAGLDPATLKMRLHQSLAWPLEYPGVPNPKQLLADSFELHVMGFAFRKATFMQWADAYKLLPAVKYARGKDVLFPEERRVATYKNVQLTSLSEMESIHRNALALAENKGGAVSLVLVHSV